MYDAGRFVSKGGGTHLRTIGQPLYRCLSLMRRDHAFASSRALATAVTRVRIEELFEIGEAKGSQLLFVPIARGSQSFEIADDLCARLRVQIAAPGLPQNTIYDFAHNAPALQSLHCSIPRRFRQLRRSIQGIRPTGRTAFRG